MKTLLSIFILLLISQPAAAINEIKGAFGLELGGLFIPQQMAVARGKMTSGEQIYYFNPNPGYPTLTEYYVKITPITNVIYEIVAEHEFETEGACKNEQETLAGLIGKKYGKVDKSKFMATFFSVDQPPKNILISCSMFENRLRITCSDSDIEAQAKKELIE